MLAIERKNMILRMLQEEKKVISLDEILKLRILPSDEIPKPEVVLFFPRYNGND